MADDESTCRNCGDRIMRLMASVVSDVRPHADEPTLWVHVPRNGPIYLRVECRLVAEPADAAGPTS
jgi:hypothetical protein